MDNDTVKVEIIKGVEGLSVCIDDTRICGSKPWGGGTVIAKWDKVPKEYLEEVLVNVIDLQAENKKLKEQQLTEDAIAEIVLQTNKDWDNYEGFDNFELFIAKAIIKARSDKKKHTCGICGEYVDHEENDCPERINI